MNGNSMSLPIALLDANVLYPAALRDVLVTLGAFNAYAPRWTSQIHEEWIRNIVLNRPDANRTRLEDTRRLMDAHIPNALVEGFEARIETLSLPDPDDRHVLAAAIEAGAQILVTFNRKDFPRVEMDKWNIQVQSPDEFTCALFALNSQLVIAAMQDQRARLKNPPLSAQQFVGNLRLQRLPQFAALLKPFQTQL